MFIAVIGLLGFLFCLVMLVIALIKRKAKKIWAIGLGVCFVLFIIGAAITPSSEDGPEAPSQPSAQVSDSPSPSSQPSAEPPAESSPTADSPEPTPEPTPETKAEEVAYEITYSNALSYKNSIGTVWVQAVFEVENTGTKNLYLSSGAYDLEDETGALVASKTLVSVYPAVIAPGEKAYYYEETTLNDLEDVIPLNIIPRPDVKAAKVELIRFPVTDVALSDDRYGGVKIIGRVENTSQETEGMTYVAAILFDGSDRPIGQVFTILMEDLEPGGKIGFEASGLSLPDEVTADSVARYEVFAYPLQMQF